MYKETLPITGAGFLGLTPFWWVGIALSLILIGVTVFRFARQIQISNKFGE